MANVHSGVYNAGAAEQVENSKSYIHVEHPAYGGYSHLIIAAVPTTIANAVANHWPRGVKIEYEFETLRNNPTPHAVGQFKSHTLFS
jgi:hypothetical protein